MSFCAACTQGGVDETWWPAALIPTEHVDESMPVPERGERVVRYFADGSYGVVDPRLTVPFDESKIPFTAYAQGLPWPAPLPLRCVRVPSTGRWRIDKAPDTNSSDSLPCAPATTRGPILSSQDAPQMPQPMDVDVELAADTRCEDPAPDPTSTEDIRAPGDGSRAEDIRFAGHAPPAIDSTTDANTNQHVSTAPNTAGLPSQSPPHAGAVELCDSSLRPDPLCAQPTPRPPESSGTHLYSPPDPFRPGSPSECGEAGRMASGACDVHHSSERPSHAPPTTAPPLTLHSVAALSQQQPHDNSLPQTVQPRKPAGGKNLLNYHKKHEHKPAPCAHRPDKAKTFLRSKGVKRAQAYLQSGTLPPGFAWKHLGT